MHRIQLTLIMTIAILVGVGCGGSITSESTSGGSSSSGGGSSSSSSSSSGAQNQPSISDLFGHDWLFRADRALKKGTQPSAPNGDAPRPALP